MDVFLTPSILILLIVLLVVLPILRAVAPQIKGWFGEWLVDRMLTMRLDPSVYKIIRDVMLPVDGATTQIDHIVVSPFGIFVIETKNFKGWIFGNERDAMWTQKIFRVSNRFQNPIRQNYRHIKVLAELTGIPEAYFKTAIAFVGEAEIKTEVPPCVMTAKRLPEFITGHTEQLIKSQQVPEIVSAISEWARTVSKEMKSRHVANLRTRHAPVAAGASAPARPKCRRLMVIRSRRDGTPRFWGCPEYPRCRGIRSAVSD